MKAQIIYDLDKASDRHEFMLAAKSKEFAEAIVEFRYDLSKIQSEGGGMLEVIAAYNDLLAMIGINVIGPHGPIPGEEPLK